MITFQCPKCNKPYHVQDVHAGKGGKCSQCGTVFSVPAAATVPQDAPTPVTSRVPEDAPTAVIAEPPKFQPPSPQTRPKAPHPVIGYILTFCGYVILALIVFRWGWDHWKRLSFIDWIVEFSVLSLVTVVYANYGINRLVQYYVRRSRASTPVDDRTSAGTEWNKQSDALDRGVAARRTAGRVVDGRLTITSEEMTTIAADPASFNNVVIMQEAICFVQTIRPFWYIVAMGGKAVAFKSRNSQVLTVRPGGIVSRRFLWGPRMLEINFADGQSQVMQAGRFGQRCAVTALDCGTWDEYLRKVPLNRLGTGRDVLPWGLVAYWLDTGKDITPYLRFSPPYGSVQNGLSLLMGRPRELSTILRLVHPKAAFRQMAAAPQEGKNVFRNAIRNAAERKARVYFGIGAPHLVPGLIVLFRCLLSVIQFVRETGNAPNIWDLFTSLVHLSYRDGFWILTIYFIVGIGLIIYGLHLKRWTRRTLLVEH